MTITPGLIASAHDQLMVDLYDRVVPSIVGLRVIKSTSAGANPSAVRAQRIPVDSGWFRVVWDDQGHIVTNRHVISDAERIFIVFSDGFQTDAEIIGADADSDLAVIKIIDDGVRPVPIRLGNSGDIRPGQLAVAIGDPFSPWLLDDVRHRQRGGPDHQSRRQQFFGAAGHPTRCGDESG